MKKLHELPKDILLQLLINVNNLSLMSDDELRKKEKVISDEIKRRTNSSRLKVIKHSLVQLQTFPHLKDFILDNLEIINSLEILSPYYKSEIVWNDSNAHFLKSLSHLYINAQFEKSLFADIENYVASGTLNGYWIAAIQIDYDLCELCYRKEFVFHYETKNSLCLSLFENDRLKCSGYPKEIGKCSTCDKTHCKYHKCVNA